MEEETPPGQDSPRSAGGASSAAGGAK